MNDTATQLENSPRAVTLYTRPTVALELVRLAEEPKADAKVRLKDCVSQDPALAWQSAARREQLAVRTESAGGGSESGDWAAGHQATEAAGAGLQLARFPVRRSRGSRTAMVLDEYAYAGGRRATISEQLWHQSGDEAFIAGLLQDIGILVLLRELGEPYARFLTGVIDEKCHLASLEQDTLGFDHIQLSAALLARWQLPERSCRSDRDTEADSAAIANDIARRRPATDSAPGRNADAARRSARLSVLTRFAGSRQVYRGMTKSKLASLVERLQPQVDQLAEVL